MSRPKKRPLLTALFLCICLLLPAMAANALVLTEGSLYFRTSEELALQGRSYDCVLVLGARVRGETLSVILRDRMDMGLSLLQEGVSDRLLLTGDSEKAAEYDEVGAMALYAQSAGVSEQAILEDPLGLSTYESLWRAKYVYGMQSVVIVTQHFHLPRALFLARELGLDAVGVPCDAHKLLWRNYVREFVARIKSVPDGIFLPRP